MRTRGSCLCSRVKFEVISPFEKLFLGHCGLCRQDTGSAHGADLFSSRASWAELLTDAPGFDGASPGPGDDTRT